MERKLLWKFNIIDLILIAVIGLGLIALIYKLTWGQPSDETQAYLFTYVCESAPEEVYRDIQPGAFCSNAETGHSLGKLTNLVLSDIPDSNKKKQGVFITTLEGAPGEHGVLVEDVTYLKGKELQLVVDDSMFFVYLSDIQGIE